MHIERVNALLLCNLNDKKGYFEMVDKLKTKELVTSFFYDCYKFWCREGKDVQDAKEYAYRDCERMQYDPYAPAGDKLDMAAKEEALANLRKFELKQ